MSEILPEGMRRELRATMCEDTYARVIDILDRWTETAQSVAMRSGVEERAAVRIITDLLVENERDTLLRTELSSLNSDSTSVVFQLTVFRQSPNRPARVTRAAQDHARRSATATTLRPLPFFF